MNDHDQATFLVSSWGDCCNFRSELYEEKADETSEKFSSENVADTLTDIASSLKDYLVGLWQGLTSGESLDDEELSKIFDNSRN